MIHSWAVTGALPPRKERFFVEAKLSYLFVRSRECQPANGWEKRRTCGWSGACDAERRRVFSLPNRVRILHTRWP